MLTAPGRHATRASALRLLPLPHPLTAEAVLLTDQAGRKKAPNASSRDRQEADQQELHLADAHAHPVRQTAHRPQHGTAPQRRRPALAQLVLTQPELVLACCRPLTPLEIRAISMYLRAASSLSWICRSMLAICSSKRHLPLVTRLLAQDGVGGAVDAADTAPDGDGSERCRTAATRRRRPDPASPCTRRTRTRRRTCSSKMMASPPNSHFIGGFRRWRETAAGKTMEARMASPVKL